MHSICQQTNVLKYDNSVSSFLAGSSADLSDCRQLGGLQLHDLQLNVST